MAGVQSFLMYSVNEGIRGLSLDPSDNSEVLMPVTGTTFAMGMDYHAGMFLGHFNEEKISDALLKLDKQDARTSHEN